MIENTKQLVEETIQIVLNKIKNNNIANNDLLSLNKLIVQNLNEQFINFKKILLNNETKNDFKK